MEIAIGITVALLVSAVGAEVVMYFYKRNQTVRDFINKVL